MDEDGTADFVFQAIYYSQINSILIFTRLVSLNADKGFLGSFIIDTIYGTKTLQYFTSNENGNGAMTTYTLEKNQYTCGTRGNQNNLFYALPHHFIAGKIDSLSMLWGNSDYAGDTIVFYSEKYQNINTAISNHETYSTSSNINLNCEKFINGKIYYYGVNIRKNNQNHLGWIKVSFIDYAYAITCLKQPSKKKKFKI